MTRLTAAALEAVEAGRGGERAHRALMTPQGAHLRQSSVAALVARPAVTLVCGRYEGFDERVRSLVDEEISLGDFVLAGGEIAAMAVIEASIRLLPGVLGNQASVAEESFSPENDGLLEYPQYTRPASFRGVGVPEVLLGGDHGKIARWRRERAEDRTRERRPDLFGGKKP
jgi:tRNA (guanine37-N1)-methyltransferase